MICRFKHLCKQQIPIWRGRQCGAWQDVNPHLSSSYSAEPSCWFIATRRSQWKHVCSSICAIWTMCLSYSRWICGKGTLRHFLLCVQFVEEVHWACGCCYRSISQLALQNQLAAEMVSSPFTGRDLERPAWALCSFAQGLESSFSSLSTGVSCSSMFNVETLQHHHSSGSSVLAWLWLQEASPGYSASGAHCFFSGYCYLFGWIFDASWRTNVHYGIS